MNLLYHCAYQKNVEVRLRFRPKYPFLFLLLKQHVWAVDVAVAVVADVERSRRRNSINSKTFFSSRKPKRRIVENGKRSSAKTVEKWGLKKRRNDGKMSCSKSWGKNKNEMKSCFLHNSLPQNKEREREHQYCSFEVIDKRNFIYDKLLNYKKILL